MALRPRPPATIESLLTAEDWVGARRAIRTALRKAPDDHWLLARLSLTYYEQRRYEQALEIDRRALRMAPHCPLVLWGYAGSNDMLGRTEDAISVYRRLIRRGVDGLARGRCGEGLRWARGLVADCWYRLGRIRERQGQRRRARAAFVRHLEARRAGASICDRGEVLARLRALDHGSAR